MVDFYDLLFFYFFIVFLFVKDNGVVGIFVVTWWIFIGGHDEFGIDL